MKAKSVRMTKASVGVKSARCGGGGGGSGEAPSPSHGAPPPWKSSAESLSRKESRELRRPGRGELRTRECCDGVRGGAATEGGAGAEGEEARGDLRDREGLAPAAAAAAAPGGEQGDSSSADEDEGGT
jgi:hypothetical protein